MPPSIALDQLKLRMRYDAGFAAYLNGVEVLRRNSPAEPAWNSTATEERPDIDAGSFDTFDLTTRQDLIKAGANVLAIQAMNSSAADPDLLSAALLTGSYLTLDPESPRYFAAPTPGVPNGFGNTNLGPVIASAQHTPKVPKPGENLLVTARVSATFQAISNVWLTYRVMYGAETNILMSDDGQSGDGQSGDGVYGATIPASAYKAGQMVRYYVRAWDVNSNFTRDPVFTRGKLAPEYWGTIVHNPALTNPLPVFYWFAQTADPVGSPGASSIYWNGQFLDNVRFTVHGQSSSGFTKRSFNVDLNPGHKLIWKDGEPSIDDINLLTTYPDKAKMRNLLAYNTYRDAGTAYHFVVPIRIEANGAFLGDWHFVENGDDNYLKRVGLDPRGALYKMYNTFDAPDGEKKTRKFEGGSMADLQEFHTGMGLAGSAQLTYIYDNLNIPEVVNYLATMTLTGNTDCCHKNYYFYRDTEGTGEWMMLPWDQDLSFGRVWSGGPTYWDDTMYTNTALRVGGNNRVPGAIFSNPGFDQMYLRRLRTLMEELLQAPGTPAHLLKYERTINEVLPTLIPDAALDLVKWGTFSGDPTNGSQTDNRNRQTVEQAANILKHEYLPGRRNWLFNSSENAQIPRSQPSNPNLLFGAFEFNPPSGNQDEEYFTLINTNRVFIDISHWKIQGAVEMTFQGGTIIPTNGTLYVAADVRRFRARQTGPRGGERLFVQGGYKGRLSARGEMIQLVNRQGEVLSQTNSPGAPSPTQSNLRVTEIMYHPAPPPANSPYLADDFEYIELTNTGDSTLSLAGVRLVSGIEFSIASSAGAPSIEAGKSVLLVRNPAAFVSRYGNSLPTIGQYTGTLSDDGENLRIVDASGEVIQDFTYNNSWYPITDGFGFSLVIIDARAPWNTWSEKSSWRPSGRFQGSPGDGDPAAPAFQPMVINEILANSTLDPEGDAIELLNPGSGAADISGWYLTDDFNTPKKHRIAPGSTIAPGAYRVIRESTFNTGNPGSFAMSSNGDEIYLFSADASGQLTGYVTGYQFGATGPGTTMGRHTNSLGEVFFVPQRSATLGQPNSGPATGPVVISEIMYHPLESDTGEQSRRMEYVELRNVTDQFVPLFDPNQPTNTWSVGGGIEWVFGPGLNLAPNASLLLVNFNPADNESRNAFVEAYAVPAGIQMFGPYGGQLDNSSEDIELYRPGVASLNNPTPRILVDWAAYRDASPWDGLADGFGPALTRRPFESFGVDPLSWRAVKPTPGYDQTATIPPTISGGRETVSILRGQPLSLAFSISGSEPMEYRWFHDGLPLSGQRSRDLNIPSIGFLDWGAYQQVAMNASGAAISSTQTVIVQQTAVFLRQPVSRNVLPGSNVTFTVTASGQGRLRYQWLYNDQMIPDATNSSFQVRAVTPANEGEYRALVTDDVAPVLSDAAMLAVFDRPQILSQPQPVAVLAGETASFTVRVGGRSPFGYRWQRASITRSNMTSPLHVNTFAITNVSTSLTGNYSVVITNL
ncbi:MAG: hypothetical protein FJ405_12570, partial [Verrucomicrobia bacterium]|nr:hypothetical protein [Verrucomicrobiota bacterium]